MGAAPREAVRQVGLKGKQRDGPEPESEAAVDAKDAQGEVHDCDTAALDRTVRIEVPLLAQRGGPLREEHWKWLLTTGGGLGAAGAVWGWVAGVF